MKTKKGELARFGNVEGGASAQGGPRENSGRPPKHPEEPRVDLKIYVRQSLRDALTKIAVMRYGKGGRRNDVIENVLQEFVDGEVPR